MNECRKCGKKSNEHTKFLWKCNFCDSKFQTNISLLSKIDNRKMMEDKSILKCKNCTNFLDSGNEKIFWKCDCGTINQWKFPTSVNKPQTLDVLHEYNIDTNSETKDKKHISKKMLFFYTIITIFAIYILSKELDHEAKGNLAIFFFLCFFLFMIKIFIKELKKYKSVKKNFETYQKNVVRPMKIQQRNTCIPRCPTCQSTNIHRITGGERVGGIIVFGIFSRKINKSFKCKNCGYMW